MQSATNSQGFNQPSMHQSVQKPQKDVGGAEFLGWGRLKGLKVGERGTPGGRP